MGQAIGLSVKTITPLLGLFGTALVLATGGCMTAVPAQPGSLVYYDVYNAGAIWRWDEGYGWNYLGEQEVRLGRNHVPGPAHPPGSGHDHNHPPGVGHHPPPPPGTPLPPGSHPCYYFFAHDGSLLRSEDGTAFKPL